MNDAVRHIAEALTRIGRSGVKCLVVDRDLYIQIAHKLRDFQDNIGSDSFVIPFSDEEILRDRTTDKITIRGVRIRLDEDIAALDDLAVDRMMHV